MMDSIVARVIDRYARRSLPFDFRAVSQLGAGLAEQAIDKLMKTIPGATGIEWELDRESVIVTGSLELPDIRGRKKLLTIVISHRSKDQASPTAGGHFEAPRTRCVYS